MNEVLLEQLIIYGTVFLLCALTILFYLRSQKKEDDRNGQKSGHCQGRRLV